MQFGKIKIENERIHFKQSLKEREVPVEDITWAYLRKEDSNARLGCCNVILETHYLMLHTRQDAKYKIALEEQEGKDCLKVLKEQNPKMLDYFPGGARIPFTHLPNTRDLGGIRTAKGQMVRPRKLIRSGALYGMDETEKCRLANECQVRLVLDFRTKLEREQKPDAKMEGVTNVFLPILNEETVGVTREEDFLESVARLKGNGAEHMRSIYKNLVEDDYAKGQYRKFFDYLVDQEEGAVLWHCSAGKDRAGTAAALVEYALGVPMDTIMKDYLRTNQYMKAEIDRTVEEFRRICDDEIVLKDVRTLFSVEEDYLQSVFDGMKEVSGSVDCFLEEELGMTRERLADFRRKYLL